jgi:hypothetical protein
MSSEGKRNETQGCCACLHVEYDPVHNEDGTATERWTCTTSGCEFVRKSRAEQAELERDEARREYEGPMADRIATLERALRDLLEEYDDRKAQFGDDYLWKKHEFTETVNAARAALEEAGHD